MARDRLRAERVVGAQGSPSEATDREDEVGAAVAEMPWLRHDVLARAAGPGGGAAGAAGGGTHLAG